MGLTKKLLLARAKLMRANPTDAERRIWSLLRDHRLAAFKFRRQQIIEPYIVDFICLSARLIIECDGSQHLDSPYDRRRDAFLHAQRFQVLRFWNNDVLKSTDDVATAIFAALTGPHPPTASRRARHWVESTLCFPGPAGGRTDPNALSRNGRGAKEWTTPWLTSSTSSSSVRARAAMSPRSARRSWG